MDSFIGSLENSPVPTVYEGRTRLVTSLLVRTTIHDSLYDPIYLYEVLSEVLASSIAGNYTLLLQNSPVDLESSCNAQNATYPPASYTWANDAMSSILCGDSSLDADERNITWATDLVNFLYEQSPTAGEEWIRIPLSCIGWKFKPKFLFRGPFGSSKEVNSTSNAPLLILSNRHDPVTPLANAYAVSQSYFGSTVVVQESWGHTALLTSRSNCTAGIVREYFDSGKLPQEGTVCEQDCVPSIPYKACPGLPSSS